MIAGHRPGDWRDICPALRGLCAAALVAASLLPPAPANAQWARPSAGRDLGPIATDGQTAVNTIPGRAQRVIREMACGDEYQFIAKELAHPEDPMTDRDIAKAQVLAGGLGREHTCTVEQKFSVEDWRGAFDAAFSTFKVNGTGDPVPYDTKDAQYVPLYDIKGKQIPRVYDEIRAIIASISSAQSAQDVASKIASYINSAALQANPRECGSIVQKITPEQVGAKYDFHVLYRLSESCLEAQIASTILDDRYYRDTDPGTNGLPCYLFVSRPGDWDQSVLPLTRLTYLLRRVDLMGRLGDRGKQALDKLRHKLLTLSGGPAEEFYSWGACGNPDNQYGSARDRLDQNDFFGPDTERRASGSNGGGFSWPDWLTFLLFIIAVALLAALLVGAAIALAALEGVIGALAAAALAAVLILFGPALVNLIFGGFEETENHLFMENSAKYLENKLLIDESYAAADQDAVNKYNEYNHEIRQWFAERFERIVRDDFVEYNAKPYARLSLVSILNVTDFSCEAGYAEMAHASWPDTCDPEDRNQLNAALGVLQLAAAKAALSSNQSRRFIPFRRRTSSNTLYMFGKKGEHDTVRANPAGLLDAGDRADFLSGALQFWTGDSRHHFTTLTTDAADPDALPLQNTLTSVQTVADAIPLATSYYQPPALILDIAVDKSTPYQQTFHHAAWERYSSGPGWLITAGGTTRPSGQGLKGPFGDITSGPAVDWKIGKVDYGAGVPTTLIVSSMTVDGPAAALSDTHGVTSRANGIQFQHVVNFLRFEGKARYWNRDGDEEPMSYENNFCVLGSFACGINMQFPTTARGDRRRFANFSDCLKPAFLEANGLFIADSASCIWFNFGIDPGTPSEGFWVVLFRHSCDSNADGCGRSGYWGFFEIVPKSEWPDMTMLANHVLDLNSMNRRAWAENGGHSEVTYSSVRNGVLRFKPDGAYVTAVNGHDYDSNEEPEWPRAQGDIINRLGSYQYRITNPRTKQSIDINLSGEP